MHTLLNVIFFVSLFLLIPVILLQSGAGSGRGIFSAGLTDQAFGAKSDEMLVKITSYLVGIFLFSSLMLGVLQVRENKIIVDNTSSSILDKFLPSEKEEKKADDSVELKLDEEKVEPTSDLVEDTVSTAATVVEESTPVESVTAEETNL